MERCELHREGGQNVRSSESSSQINIYPEA
jgi:hypothetical protein